MAYFLLLPLIFILSILSLSCANSITLSLTRTEHSFSFSRAASTTLSQRLYYYAAASFARADCLKHKKTTIIKTPLFPRGFGGYSISLSFGTPPQPLTFIMDTGSDLVWFPCTPPKSKYLCISCNLTDPNKPANIPTFKPASSSQNFTCDSQQCKRLTPLDFQCDACKENSTRRCYTYCPVKDYKIRYGSGNTTGRYLSESLAFPEMRVDNIVVGCSNSSAFIPEGGIAGFGRRQVSLPAQMGLKSFSYCLVSHEFDDNSTVSSNMVLSWTGGTSSKLQYTRFIKNPNISSRPAFLVYYYIYLQKITVGGADVQVLGTGTRHNNTNIKQEILTE